MPILAAEYHSFSARVVSVGDLHGDYDHAVAVLQAANLIEVIEQESWTGEDRMRHENLPEGSGHFSRFRPNAVRWIGGNATLVQTGDIVDRGTYAKDLYALFIHLRRQAAAAGGEVINLLGNHEVMNLHHDLRYVSRDDVAQFGSYEARIEAFGSFGWIGQDIREHYKAAAVLGDALFVHAGLTPEYAALGIDALNTATREALDRHEHGVFGSNGPLWVRHLALGEEKDVCPELQLTLSLVNARRMVVGHTQVDDGLVRPRCGGRLLMADTIISKDGYPRCWRPNAMSTQGCQASASFVEIHDSGEATAVCVSCESEAKVTFEAVSLFRSKGINRLRVKVRAVMGLKRSRYGSMTQCVPAV